MTTAWLLVPALRELGYETHADGVVASLVRAAARDGLREYYDPLTGHRPRRLRQRDRRVRAVLRARNRRVFTDNPDTAKAARDEE